MWLNHLRPAPASPGLPERASVCNYGVEVQPGAILVQLPPFPAFFPSWGSFPPKSGSCCSYHSHSHWVTLSFLAPGWNSVETTKLVSSTQICRKEIYRGGNSFPPSSLANILWEGLGVQGSGKEKACGEVTEFSCFPKLFAQPF